MASCCCPQLPSTPSHALPFRPLSSSFVAFPFHRSLVTVCMPSSAIGFFEGSLFGQWSPPPQHACFWDSGCGVRSRNDGFRAEYGIDCEDEMEEDQEQGEFERYEMYLTASDKNACVVPRVARRMLKRRLGACELFGHWSLTGVYFSQKMLPVFGMEMKRYLHATRCTEDEVVGGPIPIPKYHSYNDPNTGEPAPARGVRTNFPDMPFWAEDVAGIKRMAQASTPDASNKGTMRSKRKSGPGSQRREMNDHSRDGHKKGVEGKPFSSKTTLTSDGHKGIGQVNAPGSELEEEEENEEDEFRDEYVTYEDEQEEIDDITYGVPHAFLQEKKVEENNKDVLKEPVPNEELWWNWRKPPPDKQTWTPWHKRTGDSDTVMAAAMAETGQIKLFGEKPTVTEASLHRARRRVFYKERLLMEEESKKQKGALAYYQEWVKAWKKDTSKEAVQKHFEETGEDVSVQLLSMFQHQTREEYRCMMGTDIRIQRDPLTMRMRLEQKKQVYGGDPIYPTINYIQDPDVIVDYRGPNFHEPTPSILDVLRKTGRLKTMAEIQKMKAEKEEEEEYLEVSAIDDAMAGAVDIGENEDEAEGEEGRIDPWTGKETANAKIQFKHIDDQGKAEDATDEEGMQREVEQAGEHRPASPSVMQPNTDEESLLNGLEE
eukprot:c25668_g1_i1 orf=394-2367(-)